MRHKITMKCGHIEIHQLQGKLSEWERKQRRLEGQLCQECQRAEYERINQESAAANAEEGFAPLQIGSPKQIAWAESIRREMIARMEEEFTRRRAKTNWDKAICAAVIQRARQKNDAKWWINQRDSAILAIRELAKAN